MQGWSMSWCYRQSEESGERVTWNAQETGCTEKAVSHRHMIISCVRAAQGHCILSQSADVLLSALVRFIWQDDKAKEVCG